jgi:hypothetical protein
MQLIKLEGYLSKARIISSSFANTACYFADIIIVINYNSTFW